AHHVPIALVEAGLLLGVGGWAVVWGGFSWLAYVSFEPYVRRLWPHALVSWTRMLLGRFRDPLVGRDVLAGILGGVILGGALIVHLHVSGRAATEQLLGPAAISLRSARLRIATLTVEMLDGLQFTLAGLFFLVVIRKIVRKTWIAAG